jgi:streptogramin lyase
VARIDTDDQKVTKFPVGTNPRDIAELSGSLWITDPATPALLCVQPNGGVVRRLPMAGAPRQLAATPTAVWVASARSGRAAH